MRLLQTPASARLASPLSLFSPIGAPLSLRAGGSALGLLQTPAFARLAAPPTFARLQRSLTAHSTDTMASAGVLITVTGVNFKVSSTVGIPARAPAALSSFLYGFVEWF